jgi:hypothetical protein
MDIESVSLLLDGYLHSLRRMSGNCSDFWSYIITVDGDIESSLNAHLQRVNADTSISNRSSIRYADLEALLKRYLMEHLKVGDECLFDMFVWDITEYIQMSYRDLHPEVDPLETGEAVIFEAKSNFHSKHVYIMVPVKDKALVMGLGKRA